MVPKECIGSKSKTCFIWEVINMNQDVVITVSFESNNPNRAIHLATIVHNKEGRNPTLF